MENKIEFCTHPIITQIRHYYTKWNKTKTSVEVGYCKVCDKIVMKEHGSWTALIKESSNEEMGTEGEI